MIAWLASLPQTVNSESFALKLGNTLLRSDNDAGLAKVRRRFTKGVDIATVSMTMTSTQIALLTDWFDVQLNGGATTFSFPHPLTQVSTEFRMSEPPDIRPIGGDYFSVAMQWEKIPS